MCGNVCIIVDVTWAVGRGTGVSPVVHGFITGGTPVPRGFAMAVAKGGRGAVGWKVMMRQGLRTDRGPRVLRAVGAGKRQNPGGFATGWVYVDGKNRGLRGRGVAKQGGFATKTRETPGVCRKTSRVRNAKPCGGRELATAAGLSFGNREPACCETEKPPPAPPWKGGEKNLPRPLLGKEGRKTSPGPSLERRGEKPPPAAAWKGGESGSQAGRLCHGRQLTDAEGQI